MSKEQMDKEINDMNIIPEEQFLQERFGTGNPFRTPEGYFDTLPTQVMNRIHSHQKHTRTIQRIAIAALLSGCVATTGFLLLRSGKYSAVAENDTYMEEVLDYTLTTNLEIDSFLTEAE